jgi:alanine-glyoxylate transaminase/serine-glyoxylate transaminase/serine-pyruvate transaminase
MPEAIRQACYMPTIDHRSPLFGKILHGAGRRASGSEI